MKKLLAICLSAVMLLTVCPLIPVTFAKDAHPEFDVGAYTDGKAAVTLRFVDCVGLISGRLLFAYPDGSVLKIASKSGADPKAIGDIDNSFSKEFSHGENSADFNFYFKEELWDSARWQKEADEIAQEQDHPINGENFECAVFTFTAKEGTAIDVTGEFMFSNRETVPVKASFTLGEVTEPVEEPPEEPTTKPPEEPTTKPPEEPTTKPPEEPTTKPPEEPATKPPEEPATKPPEEPATKPYEAPTTEPDAEPTTNSPWYDDDTTTPAIYHEHVWDNGEVIVEATATQEGQIRHTCTICNEIWIEYIPAVYEQGSGDAGEDVRYTIWSNGLVEFSGSGDIYGGYAPWRYYEINSVVIGDGITGIPQNAFRGCIGLVSVTVPDSVVFVGGDAFTDTDWYNELPVGPVYVGKALYKYKGVMQKDTSFSVKAGTVSVSAGAFYCCDKLTAVVLPDSVTAIGESAFENCTSLAKVTFPKGDFTAGMNAFAGTKWYDGLPNGLVYFGTMLYGCKGVMPENTELTIKAGTKTIAPAALRNCTGLAKLTIPDSITEIVYAAFAGCTGLTEVSVPASVKTIGDSAFSDCTGLGSVSLADGVETIGSGVFANCIALPSVKIPDSVRTIGGSTFDNCCTMTEIDLGKGVEYLGPHLFENCTALQSITVPDSVTSVGYELLKNCVGLTEASFGNGLTELENSVFEGCTGLKSVSFGSGFKTIERNLFFPCTALESLTVSKDNAVFYSAGNCIVEKKTGTVIAGCKNSDFSDKGIKGIGAGALSGCPGLTEVTIPDHVGSIGRGAFAACTDLSYVGLPDSITEIVYSTFSGCVALEDVTIPTSVKKLGGFDSTGLRQIEIPSSVNAVTDYGFADCDRLTQVTVPGTVKTIGRCAFADCDNLTSAVLGNGVASIGDHAFNSKALSSIVVPASVTSIGYGAIQPWTVIYGEAGSYAQQWAHKNDCVFLALEGATVTVNAPNAVHDAAVPVYGFTHPGGTVVCSVNGKKAATAIASATGRWSASVPLNGPKDGAVYTVTAKVTFNGKTAEAEASTAYLPRAVLFDSFTLTHNYYSLTVTERDLGAALPNVTFVPGEPLAFRVCVTNNENVKQLFVVSTKDGAAKKMELTYNEASGSWFAKGFFDEKDRNYVPGVFTLEGVDVDGKAFDVGVSIACTFLIDPSGYVYEGMQSNRLEGVTATICYRDGDGNELIWNADAANQINPLATLADGAFAWVVPKGQWQVRFSKEGYLDTATEWMDVPPERNNLFIPMYSEEGPSVSSVTVYTDHADICFDQYMQIDSVNGSTVVFEEYRGKFAPIDKTETAPGSGEYLAKSFRFTPAKAFKGTVMVRCLCDETYDEKTGEYTEIGVKNYAGRMMPYWDTYSDAVPVTADPPKNMKTSQTAEVVFGETAEIGISVENAAGKTVTVSADNAYVTLSAKTLQLDDEGRATLTVTGFMPGTTKLTFRLEGAALTVSTEVTVTLPEKPVALGDVNGDGSITSADARLALRCSVGLEKYDKGSEEYRLCDVNGDGAVTSADARLILRASVGLEDPSEWTSGPDQAGDRPV